MSEDKTKQQLLEAPLDEESQVRIRMLSTVERGFFRVLREDYLPPFSGRKKKHKQR